MIEPQPFTDEDRLEREYQRQQPQSDDIEAAIWTARQEQTQ